LYPILRDYKNRKGGFPKTPTNQFTFEIELVVVD
jgi:hypothetical protein